MRPTTTLLWTLLSLCVIALGPAGSAAQRGASGGRPAASGSAQRGSASSSSQRPSSSSRPATTSRPASPAPRPTPSVSPSSSSRGVSSGSSSAVPSVEQFRRDHGLGSLDRASGSTTTYSPPTVRFVTRDRSSSASSSSRWVTTGTSERAATVVVPTREVAPPPVVIAPELPSVEPGPASTRSGAVFPSAVPREVITPSSAPAHVPVPAPYRSTLAERRLEDPAALRADERYRRSVESGAWSRTSRVTADLELRPSTRHDLDRLMRRYERSDVPELSSASAAWSRTSNDYRFDYGRGPLDRLAAPDALRPQAPEARDAGAFRPEARDVAEAAPGLRARPTTTSPQTQRGGFTARPADAAITGGRALADTTARAVEVATAPILGGGSSKALRMRLALASGTSATPGAIGSAPIGNTKASYYWGPLGYGPYQYSGWGLCFGWPYSWSCLQTWYWHWWGNTFGWGWCGPSYYSSVWYWGQWSPWDSQYDEGYADGFGSGFAAGGQGATQTIVVEQPAPTVVVELPAGATAQAPAPTTIAAGPSTTTVGGGSATSSSEISGAAETYLTLGDRAFREGRYADAVHFYAKAAELEPDVAVFQLVLFDALFATGDYTYAAGALRRALELEPSLVESDVDKRAFYQDPTEFDRQLARLETYLVDHPAHGEARLVLAANLLFSGAPAAAVDLLEDPLASGLMQDQTAALVLAHAQATQYGVR
jgi:hypothetical protein